MAYKLKGKNKAGEIYEIPLAATYDGEGNEITGTYATKDEATTSSAGLMSSTDKTKLDSVQENANNYTLPAASSTVLGGVKVYVDSSGYLCIDTE